MTLREDLNRPLPNIENVVLRRSLTIILSIIFLPICIVGGLINGICTTLELFWVKYIKACW